MRVAAVDWSRAFSRPAANAPTTGACCESCPPPPVSGEGAGVPGAVDWSRAASGGSRAFPGLSNSFWQSRTGDRVRTSAAPDAAPESTQSGFLMEAVDPWAWGDAFAPSTNDCGWTLEDWAVPLLDPAPCAGDPTDAEGLVRAGWNLAVGSTCTVKLGSSQWRMYFQNGRMTQMSATDVGDMWPVEDAAGRDKFSLKADDGAKAERDDEYAIYWKSIAEDAIGDRHFCADYISFLDSTDGVRFPMYAPKVAPASGKNCDDNGAFALGAVTYSDSGFRAGWNSTVIRTSGDTVVYRDPTVVYVVQANLYLMLVVRCDGRGQSKTGGDATHGVEGCDLCTGGGATSSPCLAGWPLTDVVIFLCSNADFQSNVSGPFGFLASPPGNVERILDRILWVGVPQALLSPNVGYLLVHAKDGGNGWPENGLHVGDLVAMAPTLIDLHRSGLAATHADADALILLGRGKLAPHFVRLGELAVDCPPPDGAPTSAVPTDPELVYCGNRLHLYFAQGEDGSGNLQWVLHAVAAGNAGDSELAVLFTSEPATNTRDIFSSLRGDQSKLFGQRLSGTPYVAPMGWTSIGGFATFAAWKAYWDRVQEGFRVTNPDASEGDGPTFDEVAANLTQFKLVDCVPIDIQERMGGVTEVERTVPDGTATRTETYTLACNDPDVVQVKSGDYAMFFHSQAYGGLLRATAPQSVACSEVTSC